MNNESLAANQSNQSKSIWSDAFGSIRKDKLALISIGLIICYSIVAILTLTGVLAGNWDQEVGKSFTAPGFEHFLGTDIFGRSVFDKVLKGSELAMSIGFVVATISVVIGVTLGLLSGYFGGLIDELIVWFYTTLSSIPNIMLLIAMTLILGKGIFAVFLALGLTYWVNVCRLVRGEVIRHKDREYVQAASALGVGHFGKIFKHILPNVTHIIIIQFSLLFQTAIKSEVILSFLGLGVQGRPSWGTMIDDAKLELARGVWWQLFGATFAMFFIVLAFNTLGDALRDALDPKLRGK